MAESSWPSAGPATVDEFDYEQLSTGWYASGLVTETGALPSPSDLLFADATGMQVKLRSNRRARVRGFTWDSGSPDPVLAIASNASGLTRVDRVVLRLDRSTWQVRAAVVQGTPGSGAPAVTRDPGPTGVWELTVGEVTVIDGAVTINGSDVQHRQSYLMGQGFVADGGPFDSQDAVNYLRYMPNNDRLLFVRAAGEVDLWRDSGWVQLSMGTNRWSILQHSYIRRVGNIVTLRMGNLSRTGTNLNTETDSALSDSAIPSEMRFPGPEDVEFVGYLTGGNLARIVIYSATGNRPHRIWLVNHRGVSVGDNLLGTTVTWSV